MKKLLEILPLLFFGLVIFLFKKEPDSEPETPVVPLIWQGDENSELTDPEQPEEMEPEPEPEQEPTPEPEPEQKKVEIDNSTTPHTLKLGGKFSVILNKTSWDGLMKQAFEENDALIDIHFNKYRGANSGPLMIYSNEGKELARALQREFIEIYEENGWTYDKEFDLRRVNLALIERGDRKGTEKPVVISEFGYVDDPANPVAEYIQSEAGHKRIAQAYKNAVRGLDLNNVALSIGHHGDRGTGPAQTGDYLEQHFAVDVAQAIFNLETPEPTGNEAEGYHHLEDITAEYPATPESIVFGSSQNLRIVSDAGTDKKTTNKWIEVQTSPSRNISANSRSRSSETSTRKVSRPAPFHKIRGKTPSRSSTNCRTGN